MLSNHVNLLRSQWGIFFAHIEPSRVSARLRRGKFVSFLLRMRFLSTRRSGWGHKPISSRFSASRGNTLFAKQDFQPVWGSMGAVLAVYSRCQRGEDLARSPSSSFITSSSTLAEKFGLCAYEQKPAFLLRLLPLHRQSPALKVHRHTVSSSLSPSVYRLSLWVLCLRSLRLF